MNYANFDFTTQNYPAQSKDVQIYMKGLTGTFINAGSFTDIDFTATRTYTDYQPVNVENPIKVYQRFEVKGTLNRGHVSPELMSEFTASIAECTIPTEYQITVKFCFPGKNNLATTPTIYVLHGVTWMDLGISGSEGGLYREKISFEATALEVMSEG